MTAYQAREEREYIRFLAAELVGAELPRRRDDALAVLKLAEQILQTGRGDFAPKDPWLTFGPCLPERAADRRDARHVARAS